MAQYLHFYVPHGQVAGLTKLSLCGMKHPARERKPDVELRKCERCRMLLMQEQLRKESVAMR